jgi:hypothetical protein
MSDVSFVALSARSRWRSAFGALAGLARVITLAAARNPVRSAAAA